MKQAAASNLKKVTLELGGKSPTLILDDSNLDSAVKWAAFGIMCVFLLSFFLRFQGAYRKERFMTSHNFVILDVASNLLGSITVRLAVQERAFLYTRAHTIGSS